MFENIECPVLLRDHKRTFLKPAAGNIYKLRLELGLGLRLGIDLGLGLG